MEKLIFLFPRKDGLTLEEFFEHYLQVHAPLGLEVTRTMQHYVVNLRDREDRAPAGVDAITETWTGSAADFVDPDKSFATREDAQRLMDDRDSFIGARYDAYAVAETVRKGVERRTPADGPSPGTKLVVALADAASASRLSSLRDRDDVDRLVENRVVTALVTGAFAPVEAFVEVDVRGEADASAAADVEHLVGGGVVYAVTEYVKK